MKANDLFKSKYLKAEDLRGKDISVTIDRVEMASMPNGQPKPAVFFKDKDKGLVLNKTNFNTIAKVIGIDDTDDWNGHQITIYPTETEFQGEMVDCIRVRRNTTSAATKVYGAPPPERPIDVDDEEIPF